MMRLQHVSIPIPHGSEAQARAFYGDALGLEERDVPPHLDPAAVIWFRLGAPDLELHLMLDEGTPAERGHLCIAVDDLEAVRARLGAAGVETADPTPIVGRPRFFCRDPFGNLLEFSRIEHLDSTRGPANS